MAAVSGTPDVNSNADLPDPAACFLEIIGMNYDFEYDYSGGNCSMIYSSGGGKEIDERIWGIVKADPERLYLLPVRIEKTWSGYLLFYDITNATNMRAWRSEATRQEFLRMDRQIQVAVEKLEDAGISRQCLVLQDQHMFVDDRTGEIRFICIPLKEMGPEPASEPRAESAWEPSPEPRAESTWEPAREFAAQPRREKEQELPPFVPGSPDEWNPAEGRDFWTPESEKWGEGWDATRDGWNPAEGRNTWESAEKAESETEFSSEWRPEGAVPGKTESSPAPEVSEVSEAAWRPETPAASDAVPAPESPEDGRPFTSEASGSDAWDDEDEATQLLLPSRKAPIEEVPEAVITRIRTGESFTIRKAVTVMGKRERTVDFCLKNNPAMSRDHCVIRYKDGQFYIEDLNSSNFTYVDGVRVMPETEAVLQNGCKIQLADEQFTFSV